MYQNWKTLSIKEKQVSFFIYNLKNKIVNQGKNKILGLFQFEVKGQWVNTDDSERKWGRGGTLGIVSHFRVV